MDPPAKPPSPSGPVQAHLFQSASNVSITGAQFSVSQTIVHGPADQARIQMVHDKAAPNAILNQGGRADEVRCHPGTRKEVLAKSEAWMDPPARQHFNISRKGIFWLSGPAGAGKSAIMQTLAERRLAKGLPMANFFFFRNDGTRSDAGPLVATILTQLFDLYHDLEPLVSAVLTKKPNIPRQSLRKQFQHLLFIPICTLRAANPSLIQQPIVLLIDGLDECSSAAKHEQQSLLKVLHDLASSDGSPFLVFVASRPEPHLVMTFNEVGSSADSIFLNEDYRPEDDIRRFVVGELAEIKKTHHLGHTLNPIWPSESQISLIVEKSSGQFIYAKTVLRFIAGSSASPSVSLDKVQGLRPINSSSPFAELDAIYTYILSQVEDWNSAKTILTCQIIMNAMLQAHSIIALNAPHNLGSYLRPLGYLEGDIPSSIADLTALVKFNGELLVFYHASFPDFLCDSTRSEDFHINLQQFADLEAVKFIAFAQDIDSVITCIHIMQHISGPTQSLTDALKSRSHVPFKPGPNFLSAAFIALEFISLSLYQYCRSDIGLYRCLAHKWVAWFQLGGVRFHPTEYSPDITYQIAIQTIESKLGVMVWQEIQNTCPGSPGQAQQTGSPVRNIRIQQPTDMPPVLLHNNLDNIGSKQSSPQPQRQLESRRSTPGIRVSRPASQVRTKKTTSGNGARTTSTPTLQQQDKKRPPWR